MAVWGCRGSSGNLRGIGFLRWRIDDFLNLAMPACPPRTGSLRLPYFARLIFFFFLLAKAQSRIRRGGLCGLAALQPAPQNYGAPYSFFFFLLAKAQSPACGRQAQRNCGPLGMTFRRGGLPLRLHYFARLIFFLFFSRKGAEAQRNCGPPTVGRYKEIVIHSLAYRR